MARLPIWLGALIVVSGCGGAEPPDDDLAAIHPPEIARIMDVGDVLQGAHIPTLDPATMTAAQITRAIGAGPFCEFRYTSSGDPVLAVALSPGGSARQAVVKLNGNLVLLEPSGDGDGLTLTAAPVGLRIDPAPGGGETPPRDAVMVFEVGSSLRVGYQGFMACRA